MCFQNIQYILLSRVFGNDDHDLGAVGGRRVMDVVKLCRRIRAITARQNFCGDSIYQQIPARVNAVSRQPYLYFLGDMYFIDCKLIHM